MLHDPQISEIAAKVARKKIDADALVRIVTEGATDSQGKEALRIVLVLHPAAARELTGDEALDLLVGMQRELQDAGEERLPIIEYATEQDLEPEEGHEEADLDEDDA